MGPESVLPWRYRRLGYSDGALSAGLRFLWMRQEFPANLPVSVSVAAAQPITAGGTEELMATAKRIRLFLARPDDTQKSWAAEAREAARRCGCELTEDWSETFSKQNHEIADCIWKDTADALIILPASQSGPAALLTQALSHGKAIVLVNQTRNDFNPEIEWSFPRLRLAYPTVLAARVAPDEKEIGRVQARQVKTLLPNGGQVLYVQGDMLSAGAIGRTEGFDEVLGGDPRYAVARVDGGWTTAGGERAVGEWLRTLHIRADFRLDLVCCQNDPMLLGAREALAATARDAHRADISQALLTGCDGREEVRRDVAAGLVAATIEVPSRTVPAVEVCADYWRSGTIPADPDVSLKPISLPPIGDLARRAR
jgi:ABC-type sugar transport system substrate-binding protein